MREGAPLSYLTQFTEDVGSIAVELENLLISKQQDYGPGNINNAPGGPINGLMVRISDKVERLKHLLYTDSEPNHESVEDSFLDLANYAVIALMVRRGLWPDNDAPHRETLA